MAFAVFFPAVELFSTAAIAIVFWYGGLRSLAGVVDVGVLITFMQYAQRFFRPIQDLSEKFNILQSAMAACERIFKLLDEPIPAPPAEAPLAADRSARRNRIPQRVVCLSRRRESEGRRLGPARRFLPHRAGTDPRHRRPHRRRKNHADPAPAALLRYSARRDSARWRGHSPLRSAPVAPAIRHRVAGPIPLHRHAGIERPPRR